MRWTSRVVVRPLLAVLAAGLVVACDPAPVPENSDPTPSSTTPSSTTPSPTTPSPTPPSTPPATPPSTPPPSDRPVLTVASFNALGSQHTSAGSAREEWGSGAERAVGMVDLVRGYRPDIIGVQEFQSAQVRTVRQRVGRTYAVFGDLDNSVMWRRSRFSVLSRTTLTIPYFSGEPRRMPVVRLRLRSTGEVISVLNVHNPASVRGNASQWRDEAVARERAFAERERAKGRIVFVVGDLNAREEAFCPLTDGGLLTSANGGTHVAGVCEPPADIQIDWIFGGGVVFDDFVSDTSTRDDQISDHPFLVATVERLVDR